VSIERLWADWRAGYVSDPSTGRDDLGCVICNLVNADDDELVTLARAQVRALQAVRSAYTPDGCNTGANIGRAAGAGVPNHLHVHVLPRWSGDTNFMTAIAEVRVLPESLRAGYQKLQGVWPPAGSDV
jgi:ATP adenylyltransferase